MRERDILFGAVASVALALTGPAIAETKDPEAAPRAEAPADAPVPAPKGGEALEDAIDAALPDRSDDTDAAKRTHLDELFRQLADKDNTAWQRTAGQIQALWRQSGSDSMNLLAYRASKAMEAKDYDTALVHLNDLVRLAPDYAEGWNMRATVHFLRDDYGQSLADIARVLDLEPRHFGALSGLGIMLDRMGEKEAALKAYRRAYAIHPNLEGVVEGIRKLAKEVEGQQL